MHPPQFILEINTRIRLRELGGGSPVSLADVPDEDLARWARLGFDAVWLCGVWLPSLRSRQIAMTHTGLQADYAKALPDWTPADVGGSPYAIRGYQVNPKFGGDAALASFRARLREHGLKLILDFIPNHTATDHPWVSEHPEWYVNGTEMDVVQHPENWFWAQTADGPRVIAHGRDPYFPPWTDTAQLDYHHGELTRQMRAELARLATLCDGVRCDMAMLEVASVFDRLWHRSIEEFWPRAIAETKAVNPDFCFLAEVYWGLDGALEEMGFDATYDKDLLDTLVTGRPVARARFDLPAAAHRRRVRFLENHDEPRIASRLHADPLCAAAAWVMGLPSVRLVYDGQLEGKRVKLPVQLRRAPAEPVDTLVHARYESLLAALRRDVVRQGQWLLLNPQSAWSGNDSCQQILGQGYDLGDEHLRILVNWSAQRSQCWVRLELGALVDQQVQLTDLTGPKSYTRDGMELMLRGLYLDLEPWEVHVFDCRVQSPIEPESAEPRAMPSLSDLRR